MFQIDRAWDTVTVSVPKDFELDLSILSDLPFNVEISYGFDTVRLTYVSNVSNDEYLLSDLDEKEEMILSILS